METGNDIMTRLWSGSLPWLETLLILAGGALAGLVAALAIRLVLRFALKRTAPELGKSVRLHMGPVLTWLLPVVGVYVAVPLADHVPAPAGVRKGLLILIIGLMALLLIRLVRVMEEYVTSQMQMDVADNLRARKFHTQFRIIRRVLTLLIVVLAGAAILLQFDGFRQFGQGLLASAGIASIVLGFAAQRTLGNLIAGFQIAITQPIRLDDVVVVEGEWGRIEEITLTYVVVKIWDERRLILPISYFLEKPFTNWTRTSSEILGTVFLHVDYTVPVDALRQELDRLLDGEEDWDGRVKEIVAVESRPTTLELRALVSARDSGTAWRLRCKVREGLVGFLQREYPDALPRFRGQVEGLPASGATD